MSTPSVIAQLPQPPCVFYGYVTAGGKPAKDGLNVTAAIAGTTLKWTTQTKGGTYGWQTQGSSFFLIPSDDPDTPEKDGGVTGDIVEFYVNGTKIDRTATFVSSGAIRVDLAIRASGMEQSTITVSLDCSAAFVGYRVMISGKLVDANGVGISGATLLATYATSGGSLKDIGFFNTSVNGNYLAEWIPMVTAENYSINVSWEGNENFERAEASVTLAVIPLEQKYVFSVVSNSTISETAYDSTSRVLGFTLEGPSETTGYTKLTIAKDLIAETTGLKIYLDENQINYEATSSETSWQLRFAYQHSSHKVTVNLGLSAKPFIETPLGIATLSGTAVIIAIAMIFAIRTRKRREKPRNAKLRLKSTKTLGAIG